MTTGRATARAPLLLPAATKPVGRAPPRTPMPRIFFSARRRRAGGRGGTRPEAGAGGMAGAHGRNRFATRSRVGEVRLGAERAARSQRAGGAVEALGPAERLPGKGGAKGISSRGKRVGMSGGPARSKRGRAGPAERRPGGAGGDGCADRCAAELGSVTAGRRAAGRRGYARWRVGRPDSTMKLARVLSGAPGLVTKGTVR